MQYFVKSTETSYIDLQHHMNIWNGRPPMQPAVHRHCVESHQTRC